MKKEKIEEMKKKVAEWLKNGIPVSVIEQTAEKIIGEIK